jgi:hypothetical protein
MLIRRLAAFAAPLLLFSFVSPLWAQRVEGVSAAAFSAAPYKVGERLTYIVSFSNFVMAAHVELLVAGRGSYAGRDGVQLRARVETEGVVSAALYAINNEYVSFVSPGTGLPFRTQQVIREGARTADSSSELNQPATVQHGPAAGVFPGTYDLLSALYRVRALPLVQGSTYRLTVQHEAEQYEADLKVTGREVVKTNLGSFNSIVTQVRVPGNSRIDSYRIRIYFSDDERHIPVLITARHPAGEIRAELAGSEILPEAPPATPAKPPVVADQPPKPPETSNPPPKEAKSSLPATLPFTVGEQLNFKIFLGPETQPVGTASYQVRSRARYFGRDGLLLTATARTTAAAQQLFSVNDQINSYVDPTTLVPFRTELRLQEGRKTTNMTLHLDQDLGWASIEGGKRFEIPAGTHDPISVLYALRSFSLTPPKRAAVSFLLKDRPLTLVIEALKREVIELGGVKVPAIQLALKTTEADGDKLKVRLWVGDDRRRLPLRLEANTKLGPVRADLSILPLTTQ